MRTRTPFLLLLLCCGILCQLPARAAYSGLTVIPTADVLPAGDYAGLILIDGTMPDVTSDTYLLGTQFGLTDRMEAGIDLDLSDDAASLLTGNVKYLLVKHDATEFALAGGVTEIATNRTAAPYLVASRPLGELLRAHLGVITLDGNNQWMVGLDAPITKKACLLADYISGDENSASAGVCYTLSDHVNVLVSAVMPNDDSDTRFSVQIGTCGSFRK